MRSLLAVVILLICRTSFAQINSIWFDKVTDEAGYSVQGVQHIVEDRDGYVWFSHSDGITKFDGCDGLHFPADFTGLNSPPSSSGQALIYAEHIRENQRVF